MLKSVKEQGQYNNFYSLQHLNYDRDCDAHDLDPNTGQIKVMRGYRHPFDYSQNNLNLTAKEYFVNAKQLFGDVYYSPEEVSTWTSSWPLLTFFSVWGLNQYLTPGGVWIFEYMGNYNFLYFGFLGKCFMLPWIILNLFKPYYLGNWTHDLIRHELTSFKRSLNDAFIDSTLEEKQKSLEQMQYMELLDLYPKLRQEFYRELQKKEEAGFRQHTTNRILTVLENVEKLEKGNFNVINNKVIKDALETLENAVQDKKVQEQSLDTAIKQLRSVGKKASSIRDPLSEAVINSLNKSRNN